ncbi:DUF4342 domain-containing protein [Chromatium okenii]|uniref:DUF4342 domain-containing protein n=1 Tax=Chromatium okenii TaxID=61644 RepID=UPI0026F193C3|nr:DUF4342 domain-containing protein [Chromatium okenii]MBV5309944.1 DUF4342 domain-containing protein [Chromatium okenii]
MKNDTDRPLFEDISVTGWVLIDKVKALIARGNVRRLIVRQPNGKVLIDVPLTAGVSVAAILTLLMPMLTAIAAMGALFTQFRIEIERDPTLFDDDRSRDR